MMNSQEGKTMKYINASDILPEPLLNEVRRYADGVYLPAPH